MDAVSAFDLLSVYLGDVLGLYRALADKGPLTSAELAEAAGIPGRYAREGLGPPAGCGGLQRGRPARGGGAQGGEQRARGGAERRAPPLPASRGPRRGAARFGEPELHR